MTDLALRTANRIRVVFDMTGPGDRFPNWSADEAVSPGQVARMKITSLTTGVATKANASSVAESTNCFLCVNTQGVAGAGQGSPVKGMLEGIVDGYNLDALNVGATVYMSATDGKLADAAGTVNRPVGTVIAGFSDEDNDKLLYVNFRSTWSATGVPLAVSGVLAGTKIARGMHTTIDANDDVVTGLTTVISAVANLESDPVVGADSATAFVGDQAGTPAAGSISIKTWKPTTAGAGGNPDKIAASTFSKLVSWIAVGT